MDLNTSVLIVSAYGRGQWLATELAKDNIPVVLIDLTSKMGVWPPEDIEGPFGFFKPEELAGSQSERVFVEDAYESVDQGFTVWLPEGPVELKSSLAEHRLQKLGQKKEVYEALLNSKQEGRGAQNLRKWAADHFTESWLLHLSHQLASTTYVPAHRSSLTGKSLKLAHPFFVRKATRAGQSKAIDWALEKKIETHQKTEIVDMSFDTKKQISGIEIHGDKGSGLMRFEQLVWMLSSEETYFVNPKVAHYLFPEGALEPEWCWVRYRLKMSQSQERESLPLHFLMLQHPTSPWTHENFVLMQRTALEDQFDAWMRIPNVQRFNKEYLRIRGDKLMENLRHRLPLSLPEVHSFPQEFYYTYSQIGPSSFPVYAEKAGSRRALTRFQNVLLEGAEVWKNFTWDDQFENQSSIRDHLQKWWKIQQQRKEKNK